MKKQTKEESIKELKKLIKHINESDNCFKLCEESLINEIKQIKIKNNIDNF